VERIGLERGRKEGQAMMIALQLTKRFGPLPKEIEERLAQADSAQLEMWAAAVLDASTLSEVFDGGRD
jgi:hypothetical protein